MIFVRPGLLPEAVQRFAISVDSALRHPAMTNATIRWAAAPLAIFAGAIALAGPAVADLKICNRMSYVAEAAIAVQERGAAASRGWFRVDPGQCRSVLQGALTANEIFIHTRVNPVYGPSPAAQTGDADFCVADGNFVIGGARSCRGGQRSVRFSAVKPSDSGDGPVIMLAEAAEYDDTQARDAGIQRLLVAAGYDASPVDGLRGDKTDAALRQFLIDNNLAPTAAGRVGLLRRAARRRAEAGQCFHLVQRHVQYRDGRDRRRGSRACGDARMVSGRGRQMPAPRRDSGSRRNSILSPKRSTPTAAPSCRAASR